MKIRMLKTAPGSIDGAHVQEFVKGREYDMSRPAGALDLARVFVEDMNVAEIVTAAVKADPDPQSNDVGDQAAPAKPQRQTRGRQAKNRN